MGIDKKTLYVLTYVEAGRVRLIVSAAEILHCYPLALVSASSARACQTMVTLAGLNGIPLVSYRSSHSASGFRYRSRPTVITDLYQSPCHMTSAFR